MAAVGFYGMPGERNGQPGPTDAVDQMEAPILALMGGADRRLPPMSWPSSSRLSTAAGVEHEVVTYPGAPHSFFDRRYEEFADASADAWQRTLAFIDR